MSRFGFLGILGALLLAAGCVPSGQYADMKDKYEEEAAKSRRLAAENAKLIAALRANKNVNVDELLAKIAAYDSASDGMGGHFQPVPGGEPLKGGGLRLSALTFRSGSAELSDAGKNTLNAVVAQLKAKPGFLLVVDGHTDNDPIAKSNNASNWELSGKRAATVVDYLVKAGVCEGQNATLRGFSEFRPIGAEKAKNRRVEIFVFDAPGLSGGASSAKPAGLDEEPVAPVAPPTRPAPKAPKAPAGTDPTLK